MKKCCAIILILCLLATSLCACKGDFTDESYKDNVSCFGWEGDKNAPLIYMDGSYHITDRNININFGVKRIPGVISWQLNEAYIPCFRSQFEKRAVTYTIKTFADKISVNGNDYVVAYSSFNIINDSNKDIDFPKVSEELIALNKTPDKIKSNEEFEAQYAIFVDKFGGSYSYPSDSILKNLGTFDEHYKHMRDYWINRVNGIVNIKTLPEQQLTDAYKAGYVYTLIVKDGDMLNVGENNYDRVFDHDCISILSALVELGDTKNFEKYSSHILDNVQYKDARWKYSLPFAYYLQKTGDVALIIKKFNEIKSNTKYIEKEQNSQGIMVSTDAIDSNGYWTVDDWSALTGLTSYKYICDYLYKTTNDKKYNAESSWAKETYNNLLKSVEKVLNDTITKNKINYIPVSLTQANTENRCKQENDANWASMFLFGSWAWEGYLFGANQNGKMLSMIDSTYSYGFKRLSDAGFDEYTYGGFTGVCSAYNAGYGSAGLRGENYRDIGINSYVYQLNNTQSAPYAWWENTNSFGDDGKLNGNKYVDSGWGSCPHIWGQSLATKVLLESLISEMYDGSLIIGRGVPESWIDDGKKIVITDYPTSYGKVGLNITTEKNTVKITISGNHKDSSVQLLALKNNIKSTNATNVDEKLGSVTIPEGKNSIYIELKK